jgi:thioredoxin reductase (NADPH)
MIHAELGSDRIMKTDVIIVGAGPCGLACAIELSAKGIKYLVLEKGGVTDAVRRYPVNSHFFSTSDKLEIGGLPFPAVHSRPTRIEALQYYRMAAEYFKLNIKLHTTVASIAKEESNFVVKTEEGDRYEARFVVVATGYYDIPRKLDIPGAGQPHVLRYYDEPYRYSHSKVVILGGGNSAIEAALDLYRHKAEVEMLILEDDFVRTAKYWLLPDITNRVKEGSIQARFNCRALQINRKSVLYQDATGRQSKTPADFILALIGYVPDASLMQQAGIKLQGAALIPEFNEHTFETNIPDLYVAGSIVGGEETAKIFIENGRWHGQAIAKDISSKL